MTLTEPDPRTLTLTHAWLDLEAERRRITEAQDRIKALLVDRLGYGRHDVGEATVSISQPAQRFDPDLAMKVLKMADIQHCSRVVIDSATAKQFLPPDLYAQCQRSKPGSQPMVRIS